MLTAKLINIKQQMYWMMLISLAGWVGLLLLFRTWWPGNTEPETTKTVLWIWLSIGVIFPAMILAGVAAILFTGLWMGRPQSELFRSVLWGKQNINIKFAFIIV